MVVDVGDAVTDVYAFAFSLAAAQVGNGRGTPLGGGEGPRGRQALASARSPGPPVLVCGVQGVEGVGLAATGRGSGGGVWWQIADDLEGGLSPKMERVIGGHVESGAGEFCRVVFAESVALLLHCGGGSGAPRVVAGALVKLRPDLRQRGMRSVAVCRELCSPQVSPDMETVGRWLLGVAELKATVVCCD